MKLIVGLGNPGVKYAKNRHNVGYIVIDRLQKVKLPKNLIVKKTNSFMNSSGEAVKKYIDQYKIKVSDLWVIHDDLDLILGSYKIQFGIGPKVHNGINSIEESLGTKDFWRVRVGIENRANSLSSSKAKISGDEYVLQDFEKGEIETLDKVINMIISKLLEKS